MAPLNTGLGPTDGFYHPHVEGDFCPTCGQRISNGQAVEVWARYHQHESKAKAEAEAAVQEKLAEAERQKAEAVQEIAEAKDVEKVEALHAKDAKHFTEIQAWNAKVQNLQRSLEQKKANDLGDGAEVDLLKDLEAAFPNDRIWRVAKGVAGADVHQVVMRNGKECGTIILDSKNRKDWKWEYVTKLHADQRGQGRLCDPGGLEAPGRQARGDGAQRRADRETAARRISGRRAPPPYHPTRLAARRGLPLFPPPAPREKDVSLNPPEARSP
jgi:hypothetical protein